MEPKLEVRLNPKGISAPLRRILRDSFNNVALGLHAIDQYTTEVKPSLPTKFFHYRIGKNEQLTAEKLDALKDNFRTWLLMTAFTDFIRAVSASLQEAYVYAEIVKSLKATFPTVTSQEKLNAWFESIKSKAGNLDFPPLIERVSERLTSPLDLAEHLLSINKVRNCLEHRDGVVQKADVNSDTKDALVLKWRRPKAFYERKGDEIEATSGPFTQRPASVRVKVVDTSKTFKLREKVRLTVDEFCEVMFTCAVLERDILSKLPSL